MPDGVARDTLLQMALKGDRVSLREALASGENVNAWDERGMTPLLYAVFIGNSEGVRLILEVGADPNQPHRDDRTATPLWHARDDFGLHEIADLLVAAGAREK